MEQTTTRATKVQSGWIRMRGMDWAALPASTKSWMTNLMRVLITKMMSSTMSWKRRTKYWTHSNYKCLLQWK